MTTSETFLSKIERTARLVAYTCVILAVPVIVFKVVPLLDRAVTVLENMDERVERAFEGAAPVGKATVEKGVNAIRSVDTEEIGRNINGFIKRKLEDSRSK